MRVKRVFTLNYIYAFIFGVGFLLVPNLFCSLIGFDTPGDAVLIARVLGIFVMATGLLTFFTRNAGDSEARRAIILTLFVLYILLILYKVLLHLAFGIGFNVVFAIIYVIHVSLVVAYGSFLFRRKSG